MSKIKALKTDPNNNINVIDILNLLIPNEKVIYFETLLKLMKNTNNYNEVNEEIKSYFKDKYNTDEKTLNKIPPFHLMFYYKFLNSIFNEDDLVMYNKFVEYNERKLIENNDIVKYTSFDDIKKAVNIVDTKAMVKELEKQTIKVFEDDEYLIVMPLTYLSSKKYGANTKWCTTSNNNYSQFRRYTSNGMLIYILNKVSGEKVAVYYSLSVGEKEFSFWNQVDLRIDSIESGLPHYILDVIKTHISCKKKINRAYLTKDELLREDTNNGLFKTREPVLAREERGRLSDVDAIEDFNDVLYEEGQTDDVLDDQYPSYEGGQIPDVGVVVDNNEINIGTTKLEHFSLSNIISMRNGEGI